MRSRLLALVLATTAVTACGGQQAGTDTAAGDERLDVSVGVYPYAFVAERVGGSDVTVTNLAPPGAEPHDLELSPRQVAGLQDTDLVVYSPGFQPALDEAVEQQAADRALDVLAVVEAAEGTEPAEEEPHADEAPHSEEPHSEEPHSEEPHAEEPHADEAGDAHSHEGEDPHVWLDPTRLALIADAVADELAELAPERADAFRQRADELTAELEQLDGDLRTGLATCERKEIVTSHDAFGYLADAYGLEQVALAGLSPEDEASPKRLAEVARFAKEHGVTTVFFEELVSPKVAESLAREVGARAEQLSPLEGAPESGDYLTAMRANLDALRTALGCA